ncbi:MAG: tetratricopeptide repeat protein [Thermoanaerobaculia bacterium]|nr:tetratricopeptide repeat protein [Thermoanaerobaculia bacterium]
MLAFNAGVKALQIEDRDTAKTKFREAADLDPTLGPPHLALADIYFGTGAVAEAAVEIEAFLATAPDDPQGLRLAYRIYQQLGDPQKLALALEAVRNTDFAKTLAVEIYNEGAVATQARDYERAAERFTAALGLDPALQPAYEGLVQVQYHLERYQEALTTAAKLLELDPSSLQGRRVRYLVYDALDLQEKLPDALAAYQEVDPEAAVEVLYQRAEIDFRTGESARAKAALLEILKQKPDMARAHYTLGLVYASESANAEARKHLERFLALAPDDPDAADARDILKYL